MNINRNGITCKIHGETGPIAKAIYRSEEYFKIKTVVPIVNKDALPEILKKKRKIE